MAFCYIGLGANLNDPVSTVKIALHEMSLIPQSRFVAASKIYVSKPMGPADQPDYVNAVALIETQLNAHQLFEYTCRIEQDHGRTRNGEHWGPRTLDLDILLFDQDIIDDDKLTVPHYGIKDREFVIYPLLDISPNLVLPCGTSIESLTENVPLNGMTAL
ncbi:MAG: 2-amino-4-hydroxy-6-hydroxymethyldihydropteridine diphosphokinase [Gammaproteobacteria bacterium]|nr:2-amino-4-hydroxy-6-hydroxymethyldihydropteridine diphosphokinase [Gammaproteobacteria bacterium]